MGDLALDRKQTFLDRDGAATRRACPDHAPIESMGLGCVITVSVRQGGAIPGAPSPS